MSAELNYIHARNKNSVLKVSEVIKLHTKNELTGRQEGRGNMLADRQRGQTDKKKNELSSR